MKRTIIVFLFLMIFSFNFFCASERVNLINEHTYIQQEHNAAFEDGVLALTEIEGEYVVNFNVERLTNSYTWEGDIKITDINTTIGYSGIRFCIGYDEVTGNYINLILTRNMGVSANQRGTNAKEDLIPLDRTSFNKDLEAGMNFHFEIVRDGAHVIMKIDDETIMDHTFDEDFNLFSEGDDFNLGFVACMATFEVHNLAVYDENVEITPVPTATPKSTPTPDPTEFPEATVTPSEKIDTTDEGGVSPVIVAVAVVAVVVVLGAIIYLINKKIRVKGKRKGSFGNQ